MKKSEIIKELELKMEEFGKKSVWAAKKADVSKGSKKAAFEAESAAWNDAAWEIKGLLLAVR